MAVPAFQVPAPRPLDASDLLPAPVAAQVDMQKIVAAVKAVAAAEIVPRFRSVRIERKADGSILTEADTPAQAALEISLQRIFDCTVLGEEMLEAEQRRIWEESE